MPYVIKNSSGKIVGAFEDEQKITSEWVEEEDKELQSYKQELKSQVQAKNEMQISDLDLIRVLEDLTELLIKKQVIAFTELPIFAQQKLGTRQKMRTDMVSLKSLINEDEGIF
jgi:signal recognition particle GTPase